jgi:hypothetical protein
VRAAGPACQAAASTHTAVKAEVAPGAADAGAGGVPTIGGFELRLPKMMISDADLDALCDRLCREMLISECAPCLHAA